MTGKDGRTDAQDTTRDLVRQLRTQITEKDRDIRDLTSDLATAHAEKALRGHTDNVELLAPQVAKQLTVARDKGGRFVPQVLDKDGKSVRLTEKSNSTAPMSVDELVTELKSGPLGEYFGAGETATAGTTDTTAKQTATSSSEFQISMADAQDSVKYRQIRKQAMEAGQNVQVLG